MRLITRYFFVVLPALMAAGFIGGCKDRGLGLPCLVVPAFCERQEDCDHLPGFSCQLESGICVQNNLTAPQSNDEAIECPTGFCLQMPQTTPGCSEPGLLNTPVPACTQFCESDNDCQGGFGETCVNDDGEHGEYVCAYPFANTAGEYGCKRFCICRWYAESNCRWSPETGETSVAGCD